MNPETKKFLSNQMIWMGVSLAISLAISIVLPFPLSLGVIVVVFLGLNYYIRRRQMRLMGMHGRIGGSFPDGANEKAGKVDYYCIGCGLKHNESVCPNCGSRMKRAQF